MTTTLTESPATDVSNPAAPATMERSPAAGNEFFPNLWRDVRFSGRLLKRDPGFTVLAVLTLALGLGATTAIFSALYGILLRPLPYTDSERIVRIWQSIHNSQSAQLGMTEGQFVRLREATTTLSQLGAYRYQFSIATSGLHSERLATASTSAGVLPALGMTPVIGRAFRQEDETPQPSVALLTYNMWQEWFDKNPAVLGKTITVDGSLLTIVGVLPQNLLLPDDYTGADRVKLWMPLGVNTSNPNWTNWSLLSVGRLRPGSRVQRTAAECQTLFARLWQEHPVGDNTLQGFGWALKAVSVRDDIVGDVRTGLWIITGAVCLVLAIVCANIASLLLLRAVTREKEIATRMALGAPRRRIVSQLLAESLMISLMGGLVGLGLAAFNIRLIIRLGADNVPRLSEVSLNLPVLLFGFLTCLVSAVCIGLFPAIQATRPDLNGTLRDQSRGVSAGAARNRTYRLLVIGEVAAAVVLVIAAGLLLRSYSHVLDNNPGFNPDNVITQRITLPPEKYNDDQSIDALSARLISSVESLPGVKSAAITSFLPLTGVGLSTVFTVEGGPISLNLRQYTKLLRVTPEYFSTMGIPLLHGRFLENNDTRDSSLAVVISEAMANTYWPNASPIGRHIRLFSTETDLGPAAEVVGVVKDTAVRKLNEDKEPQVYLAMSQAQRIIPWKFGTSLVFRMNPGAAAPGNSLRQRARDIDSSVVLSEPKSEQMLLADTVSQPHFNLVLLGLFAVVALILAAVGVYGVLALSVRQRTREIGIRVALGATRDRVLRLVMGQCLKLVGTGLLLGLVIALSTTQFLKSLLYGVSAMDPFTFVAVSIVLLAVAAIAAYVPTQRALRVDPMVTLRQD